MNTSPYTQPSRAGYVAFLVALGLAGWFVLLAGAYLPGFGPERVAEANFLTFALFLVAIVAARGMAFELLPQSVVSLDSAFYVAAAVCLGPVTAGLLVALALTLDTLYRLLRVGRVQTPLRDHTWSESLAYVLYFGGMTGSLLAAAGWLFFPDGGATVLVADQAAVLRTVFGVGALFLVVHYGIQGVRQRLLGRPLGVYLRSVAVWGILAEVSLMPLAVVVVYLYDPGRPLGFSLLAITFLVINFVYNRLSRAGRKLRKRVAELEALNASARQLAASLQLHALVDSVAQSTVTAIDEARGLILLHRPPGAEADDFAVDAFDRDTKQFQRLTVTGRQGVTGWVIDNNCALSVRDLQNSDYEPGHLASIGVRAWIGVPLVIYGNVEGVLAVHSFEAGVFDDDDLFLLESIGAQVAVALQNAHLYELAMVDGLTKLFVRRYFDARLDEEILRARRFQTVFSVVMMDIDNFKMLNDTYGHPVGDKVLRAIADVVRGQMRGVDTAARYGGEEVSLILPRTDMVSAYNLAERIRTLISELELESDDGEPIEVSASFGIAAHPESGAVDAAELVRLADRALYRSKMTGKNRVELYWGPGGAGEAAASIRPVK